MSEWLKVYVCKDKNDIIGIASELENRKKIKVEFNTPLQEIGDTTKWYKVIFMPDIKVFETITFNAETIVRKIKRIGFLK